MGWGILRLNELVFAFAHDEDRAGGMAQDAFGGAAQEDPSDASASVSG